ncbi:hypothetical protein SSS_03305 [Sarcoptes scabiei]|nr:hypothetical protein SSS_03305 [Sarcoptes scabiei]
MMVGEIKPGQVFTEYLGYNSEEESKKKLIRNVRRRGDFAFLSGDLMEMDFFGNLYFKDRLGDTFRWKGENVSTIEIEMIIAQFLGNESCTIYGVQIPQCEGRAGMLATTKNDLDLQKLYQFMKERIPSYALPRFIRITDEIPTTTTHKIIKNHLQIEGYDLNRIKQCDKLFYLNLERSSYEPIDQEINQQIQMNLIRF